ncbi:bifunctional 3-(3-hydroxy-phenyl)propionate/3-hydroxycinnamic acid hydroxylase [Saccharopolyspora sp. TS4A08]|uniref:Bifunctional 3-(3-hydroxy-phenyl)propionate/3-hydroxycinnamic acid hydroxylase n=1 Tax=Saccharopolyspora ipomoeae TaxID=3042027 RepID=A0ABT6PTM5_9PSEU|nr:bifunctional 3-(3-hydroxy-phenyl)propionate/3-hydroxycinnamic acid hydroxylase [Saccharopolyspora sp. TS4A08]MDI2031355.1 bifunctional 3-(3-hydroxy-phenyl)propionate/3-hydroxycinnamic acid hydroxylase [Saccharopolyspora sp. TS4A08]
MSIPAEPPRSDRGADADVVIVGCGPVGLTLALLLAHRGWQVAVLERYAEQYPFPRVVTIDGETSRNFAAAGIGDQLHDLGEPMGVYEFRNAAGEVLLSFDAPYRPGHQGWPKAAVMHQPSYEAALRAHAETLPNLRLLCGHEVEDLTDHGDRVEVRASGPALEDGRITGSWLVGCDGANSVVREHIGAQVTDHGFSQDWLLCDVVFHEPREFHPTDVQICDPARPTTIVASGRGHRRWEFMLLPGETVEEFSTEEALWRLLEPHGVSPENAKLTRNIVYTFDACMTEQWRSGRLLLAGDSAHLMPPFAGQGMCSGVRDAASLAWRLDLVLGGRAAERLLDTYPAERAKQVRRTTDASIEMGKLVSELDPAKAAARDEYLIAARSEQDQPEAAPPSFALEDGFLRRALGRTIAKPAGELMPQGAVARGEQRGLFDDVVGRGFVLLSSVDPREALDDESRSFLDDLGAHLVRVLPFGSGPKHAGPHEVVDVGNTYLPYLTESRQVAVLVRPDFYVFGGARDRADLTRLVRELRAQITGSPSLQRRPVAARRDPRH